VSAPGARRARHPERGPHARRAPEGPAPPGSFVAVLERRGRFLTAEPLFHRREPSAGPSRRGAAARVTLGPARSGAGARMHAAEGDLVLVQVPTRGSGARVARVLGRPDVAADVIEALLLDRGLARGFDAAVEAEARDAAARVARSPDGRRDLRELPTFTVDPASARDFDDAISAEPLAGDGSGGAVRIWVHIADVAAHVRDGSLVDREARRRATSVYAPGAVEPMLPHVLSSDACSLVPGQDRAAVTVEMELDGASVTRAAFHRSLIRSDARLDYEQVDRIFAGAESAAEPWGSALRAARQAAAALQSERERRGALAIESEEPEFEIDEHGDVTAVLPRAQTESHRLIEHLMIAANECVAKRLHDGGVPCLYRVHERPEPERVVRLADQLASLEVPTPPLPASSAKAQRMSSSQAAELVGEISQMVDAHVRRSGGRGRLALGALVLRSLMQAYYSPRNLGHAGLRSPCYCHFTSPIRRYPDLVCHRALVSTLGGPEPAPRAGEMADLGAWTSERERDAMLIERDADDVARCFALERQLREGGLERAFDGEITGLISAGAFVAFGASAGGGEEDHAEDRGSSAQPFEGMLPVRLMRAPGREGARDWWELNDLGTILYGERSGATLRLGDPVRVRVARVDAVRGRVDLEPG